MRETEAKLEATTTALTLRAEAAEHQLQWQEDVLARCSAAEVAHTAAAEEARLREEEVSEANPLRTCRVASERGRVVLLTDKGPRFRHAAHLAV